MDTTKVLGLDEEEKTKLEEARETTALSQLDEQVGLGPKASDALLYVTRLDRARREVAQAEAAVRDQINMEPGRTEASKADQLRPHLARLEQARDELDKAEKAAELAPGESRDDRFHRIMDELSERIKAEDELVDAGLARLDRVKSDAEEQAEQSPEPTAQLIAGDYKAAPVQPLTGENTQAITPT